MRIDEDAPFLLDQLEQLALKLGIHVRYEELNPDMESVTSRGGLCRVKKPGVVREPLYLVDEDGHHFRLAFDCSACEMAVFY